LRFINTEIENVHIVELDLLDDDRGFFARSWCKNEFGKHRLNIDIVQCNISFNKKKGTLRGLHVQTKPFAEAKLIRCTMGAIFDVLVDLREASDSYKKWMSVVLDSNNRKMIYVPEGVAHGFQTLEDNTEVFYQMSEFYYPEYARGFRWDDPVFNIKWPLKPTLISEKDRNYEHIS